MSLLVVVLGVSWYVGPSPAIDPSLPLTKTLVTQGELGLTIDALESVRLVGADGSVKAVSVTSYPDLFWAIRGAGANFGVITAATFKVQTLASNNNGNVWMLDFYLPAERSLEYFNIIEKNYSPMPTDLAGVVVFNWNSTTNAVSFPNFAMCLTGFGTWSLLSTKRRCLPEPSRF